MVHDWLYNYLYLDCNRIGMPRGLRCVGFCVWLWHCGVVRRVDWQQLTLLVSALSRLMWLRVFAGACMMSTFIFSALVHEYIIAIGLGFFCESLVCFLLFCAPHMAQVLVVSVMRPSATIPPQPSSPIPEDSSIKFLDLIRSGVAGHVPGLRHWLHLLDAHVCWRPLLEHLLLV